MKKIVCFMVLITMLIGGTAVAQERTVPMLREGVKDFGLRGWIDFEGAQGDVDVILEARYGYYLNRNLLVGGLLGYSRQNDANDIRYDIGAFAEYHLFGIRWVGFAETVPYFGASVGLGATDRDLPNAQDETALTFIPSVGVKWFFRDYVAIDTNLFLALATDDIYINDNDPDDYMVGARIGLRVLFE
jgi:hypothetical protein